MAGRSTTVDLTTRARSAELLEQHASMLEGVSGATIAVMIWRKTEYGGVYEITLGDGSRLRFWAGVDFEPVVMAQRIPAEV